MNKIAIIGAVSAGLVLSACASDGTFAGKSKPIDKEQTRLAMCEGAQKIDIAFAAINSGSPGLIPDKVLASEAAFIDTVGFKPGAPDAARPGSVCAKQYAGDVDVAINTAVIAISNISELIKAWQRT